MLSFFLRCGVGGSQKEDFLCFVGGYSLFFIVLYLTAMDTSI